MYFSVLFIIDRNKSINLRVFVVKSIGTDRISIVEINIRQRSIEFPI